LANVEEHPTQVVKLEHFKSVGQAGYGLLDGVAVLANDRFASGLYFSDDSEAVTGGSAWIGWAVSAILDGKYPSFGIAIAAGLDQSVCWAGAIASAVAISSPLKTRKIYMGENYCKRRRGETR
jgi:hypothetical protein